MPILANIHQLLAIEHVCLSLPAMALQLCIDLYLVVDIELQSLIQTILRICARVDAIFHNSAFPGPFVDVVSDMFHSVGNLEVMATQ